MIIIVIGGLGSTTGAVLAAIIITWGSEWLRRVEEPFQFFGYSLPGLPGLRMVIFALLLLFMIIFARRGLCGSWEFSWAWLLRQVKGRRAA